SILSFNVRNTFVPGLPTKPPRPLHPRQLVNCLTLTFPQSSSLLLLTRVCWPVAALSHPQSARARLGNRPLSTEDDGEWAGLFCRGEFFFQKGLRVNTSEKYPHSRRRLRNNGRVSNVMAREKACIYKLWNPSSSHLKPARNNLIRLPRQPFHSLTSPMLIT